jgi:hypothetical protein
MSTSYVGKSGLYEQSLPGGTDQLLTIIKAATAHANIQAEASLRRERSLAVEPTSTGV